MFTSICRSSARFSCLLLVASWSLLLAGCGGNDGPVTAESSKFKPASGDKAEPAADARVPDEDSVDTAAPLSRKVTVKTKKGQSARGDADAANVVPESPFADKGDAAAGEPAGDAAGGKYSLPKEGTQALLKFIDELGAREPEGTTRDEVLADATAIQEARLAAAKRALGDRKLDERTRNAVLRVCMQIHELLAQIGVRDARERYEAFVADLAASDDPALAESGRLQGFQLRIKTLMSKGPLNVAAVTAEVKQLVTDEKESVGAFVLGTAVCEGLDQMAVETSAARPALIELLTFLGTTYEKNEEPQIAAGAKQHQ